MAFLAQHGAKTPAIPFVNKDGHVMRLAGSMTLRELLKMGVVEIHLAKPGTPLRDGEWRDATPDAHPPNTDEGRSRCPIFFGEKSDCPHFFVGTCANACRNPQR